MALYSSSVAERRVYLSSRQSRIDLRAQHRQPDQAGHVGVLSLVDGDAQGGPSPLGVASTVDSRANRGALVVAWKG